MNTQQIIDLLKAIAAAATPVAPIIIHLIGYFSGFDLKKHWENSEIKAAVKLAVETQDELIEKFK